MGDQAEILSVGVETGCRVLQGNRRRGSDGSRWRIEDRRWTDGWIIIRIDQLIGRGRMSGRVRMAVEQTTVHLMLWMEGGD